jgi:hypothetical protein
VIDFSQRDSNSGQSTSQVPVLSNQIHVFAGWDLRSVSGVIFASYPILTYKPHEYREVCSKTIYYSFIQKACRIRLLTQNELKIYRRKFFP